MAGPSMSPLGKPLRDCYKWILSPLKGTLHIRERCIKLAIPFSLPDAANTALL
jgi:hypothetical protein